MAAPAPLSEGDSVVIATPEEIDLSNADDLRERLLAALDAPPAGLIVDMSGTSFCDSTGLSALLKAQHRSDEIGSQLRLVATHSSVLKILRVTGLHTVFDVRASVEEAAQGLPG